MDFKPFLHEHYLLFDEYEEQESSCHRCNQQIEGWAYTCESCNFWLHDSCATQELPGQISHPLHPQHDLQISIYYDFDMEYNYICTKCFNLGQGHRYCCKECDFNLDLPCAFSSDINKPNDFKSKTIWHFSLEYPLTLFNYRRVGKYDYSCSWCERHLSGICYGNLQSVRDIVLFHESCLNKMPSIISKHPFHPSHPLQILKFDSYPETTCNACKDDVGGTHAYCCRKCKFHLHVGCAMLQLSLKVELHEHELTYFRSNSGRIDLPCKICNQDLWEETCFYRCVPCDFSYHLDCLGISSSAKHKYHRHSLELVGLFIEDDSTEYYCDICEEERKPDHHVYCCKNCKYVAHIECVLNKVCLLDRKASTMELVKKEKTEQKNAKFPTNHLDIEYFDHPHPLSFIEAVEQNEKVSCCACDLEISGQCYTCKSCEYAYSLHKACSMLPYEVLHPLHPQHSLKLFTDLNNPFTCHECRYLSSGFVYKCYPCDFRLDVLCATSTTTPPKNEDQRLTKIERVSKLCPFNPNHELEFFTPKPNSKEYLRCEACYGSIVSSAYRCLKCDVWPVVLDESCIESLKEMQHPFHPLHSLRPLYQGGLSCSVCKIGIFQLCYGCEQCDFYLHLDCTRALKQAPLNFEYHSHDLFYCGPDNGRMSSPTCDKCGESCWGTYFYFCFKCKILLHLKCVPIPTSVKSKCHIHRLTLKDRVVEDNSGEYYCDVCEEKRNPKYHVYCCEECDGLFVAHIECVLPTMEEAEGINLKK